MTVTLSTEPALKEREEKDYREAVEGIRRGLEDIEAGRTQPLAEAFANIRRRQFSCS